MGHNLCFAKNFNPAERIVFKCRCQIKNIYRKKYCRHNPGNDTLTLFLARPLESGAVLHGVWRANPGPCTPCDCMRMPMLSFYNLPIEE